LSAENVRVFVAEDPLNSQLEVVVNEVRALNENILVSLDPDQKIIPKIS
jgi:hypothetical protein